MCFLFLIKEFLHILNVELFYLFLDRFVCIEHTVYIKGITDDVRAIFVMTGFVNLFEFM